MLDCISKGTFKYVINILNIFMYSDVFKALSNIGLLDLKECLSLWSLH